MTRKKINRKELKQPDEFITFSAKVIQWGQAYGRQIGYGAIAIVVLILAIVGYRYFDNRSELTAFSLLSQANAKYAAFLQGAATSEKGDEDIKAAYQRIVDKYSTKDAGKIARKALADIYFDADQYDQAVDLYERSLKDFNKDPFYRSIILNDLALAHEANNNDQGAIDHYEMVSDVPNAPLIDQALFHLAGLYEKRGDADKARELYERIIAEQTGSIYIDMVKEMIGG